MPLGLSKSDLARRRGYVMASDAKPIMEGAWREVWRRKKGLAEEDDLSGVLPVQLGSFTEPFNAHWYGQVTGRPLDYYSANPLSGSIFHDLSGRYANENEFQKSEDYPWMACSLDGLTVTQKGRSACWDAKHVGQFRYDELVLRYSAAMTHQCVVMGLDYWVLSVLCSNSKLEIIEQAVDPFYAGELIEKTRAFWRCVEEDREPEDLAPPVEPPKPQPRLRIVQLEDEFQDSWPNWAGDMVAEIRTFASTNEAATLHTLTRERIKALCPEDVGEITRGQFRLSRTRAGALTMVMRK